MKHPTGTRRHSTALFWVVASTGLLLVQHVDAAGTSDLISASSQANEEASASVHTVSRTGLLTAWISERPAFTVSDLSMLMGPAMNNLDGHIPSSLSSASGGSPGGRAGKHGNRATNGAAGASSASGSGSRPEVSPGTSMRHVLSAAYFISPGVRLGPVIDVQQKFYGEDSGTLQLGDPELRLAFSEIMRKNVAGNDFRSGLWTSVYAPTGKMSRASHMRTAVNTSFVPVLRIRASRFSLSGMASARVSMVDKPNAPGSIYPVRLMGGVQENYQLSRVTRAFLMNFVSAQLGPRGEIDDANLAAQMAARMGDGSPRFGLMPGVMVQATPSISISPRMSWMTNQPIETTTVGLNVSVLLI